MGLNTEIGARYCTSKKAYCTSKKDVIAPQKRDKAPNNLTKVHKAI